MISTTCWSRNHVELKLAAVSLNRRLWLTDYSAKTRIRRKQQWRRSYMDTVNGSKDSYDTEGVHVVGPTLVDPCHAGVHGCARLRPMRRGTGPRAWGPQWTSKDPPKLESSQACMSPVDEIMVEACIRYNRAQLLRCFRSLGHTITCSFVTNRGSALMDLPHHSLFRNTLKL